MRRSFFIAATVAMLTPTISLAGTVTPAEFVGGTAKSIPANTTGSLDAGSSTELRFHYGKSVFSLPYANITGTELTEPTGKHLWRVPVPKLGKGSRFLNISYHDGTSSRMVTFKTSASAAPGVVSSIQAHRKDPQTATASTTPAPTPAPTTATAPAPAPVKTAPVTAKGTSIGKDTESWWGDQYWRTTRNKAKWPEVPAENTPGAPAGTKE